MDSDLTASENRQLSSSLPITPNETNASISLYGKEALQQLKSEQKFNDESLPVTKDSSTYSKETWNDIATKTDSVAHGFDTPHETNVKNKTIQQSTIISSNGKNKMHHPDAITTTASKDEDYIPLKASSEQKPPLTILTGEEALAYIDKDEDKHHDGYGSINQNNHKYIDRTHLGTETLSNNATTSNSKRAGENIQQFFLSQAVIGGERVKEDVAIDEGGRKWEEEISRRAGVCNNFSQASTNASNIRNSQLASNNFTDGYAAHQQLPNDDTRHVSSSSSVVSDIKATIQMSLEKLKQSEQDLELKIERRRNEYEIAAEEANKKETEYHSYGKSFEFYQNLRFDLSNWVGALRHLDTKVGEIEATLEEFQCDVTSRRQTRWREWEDDSVSIISHKEFIDRVVGRQLANVNNMGGRKDNDTSLPAMVDEFGRDVRRIESLARVKRRKHRNRARIEGGKRRQNNLSDSPNLGCNTTNTRLLLSKETCSQFQDSDGDVSDNELMDKEERRMVLSDAVQVVLGEIDEEYSSAPNLILIFERWWRHYPNDYCSSYANLSLVDLLYVFIRVDFCKNLDLPCIANGALEQWSHVEMLRKFPWFDTLKELDRQVQSKEKNCKEDGNEESIKLLMKKLRRKLMNYTLGYSEGKDGKKGLFDPVSEKQSLVIGTLFGSLQKILFEQDNRLEALEFGTMMLDYLKRFLYAMAIPILKQHVVREIFECTSNDEECLDTVLFCTLGQLHRLIKLVSNIARFWYPLFEFDLATKIAQFCLVDIVTYRLLPILGSLQNSFCWKQAVKAFISVFETMMKAGWLDCSSLMLYSAPIRAAASRYIDT